jgi:cholesterol transport system auxiliary component
VTHPSHRTCRRLLLARSAGTGLMLTGCLPQLPGQGPQPRTFRVTPKYTFPEDLPKVGWTLAVAEPSSERTLDTTRIAVVTNGTNVDFVALAFWIDRAPAMMQTLIVQSFRNSGAIAQVGTNRDRLRPQFLLVSELRAFQINRGQGPDLVRVRLDAQLLKMPQRDSIGRESFAAELVPAAAGLDATVLAFDEATGKVLKDLVVWVLRAGQRVA